jgi:hypothetical protein
LQAAISKTEMEATIFFIDDVFMTLNVVV